ncbi:transcriptional regulator, BadM/Rrf2 family [Streptomyces sp. 2131.1]|uniref:RrF2 family transcriptional regulator n=1 Tax=Streptomyces sp. 2131.1 TaxID=1855346 RepID=UPI00089B5D65|nr:Rrf2 family transcriptional regulator [Streptomyces sp. 2131.1]SEE22377.1 transcriptional regulator, BadM/Rrf2 family [Streptomyces sp. 2131.1]
MTARLAELHNVSPSYLAKQLQALTRAGLVQSVQGKAGGYILTRPPALITVLDVVEAVDGPGPAFVCTEIRQRGPMATPPEACAVPCAIRRAMGRAETAWWETLRSITVADLAADVTSDSGPGALGRISTWLNTASA